MTILIIGGTGQTGVPLSKLLHNAGHSVLVASRSGKSPSPDIPSIQFDWLNPATHATPFTETEKLGISVIDRVYLIAPTTLDNLASMKPFIELGIEKGVKRYVLLGSSALEPGDLAMGKVHEYFIQRQPQIDFVVLRPSWFFGPSSPPFQPPWEIVLTNPHPAGLSRAENFQAQWLQSIRDQNEIPTVGGDGKVPFIAVDDIAEAAVKALTIEPSPNTDWVTAGPDVLTFDDVANLASEVLGRKIVHKRQTQEEHVAWYVGRGLTEEFATALSSVEGLIAQGVEEAASRFERKYVGKRHLRDWFEENKALWVPQN
ncbi:hypothetical protein AX16_007084 [Volvariella volvacea WC 439]|nr:hypothetical protein AX16_007084 [Volvariella volvacea WC 439]